MIINDLLIWDIHGIYQFIQKTCGSSGSSNRKMTDHPWLGRDQTWTWTWDLPQAPRPNEIAATWRFALHSPCSEAREMAIDGYPLVMST